MSSETGSTPGAEVELSTTLKSSQQPYDAPVVPSEALQGDYRVSSDLTWVNLSFKVKDKSILTKCWGKVCTLYFDCNYLNALTVSTKPVFRRLLGV